MSRAPAGYDGAMSARYDADFAAIFGGRDRGDLAFFQRLAREHAGPVCEIGAGTGRVILAVGEVVDGCALTGVEPSDEMRAVFEVRLASGTSRNVKCMAGSFTSIPLGDASQGLVFSAFRSFQHVLTTDEQLAALAEVRRVLRPGGIFALDLFDPAYRLLRRARPTLGVRYRTADGRLRERWESREIDRVAQRVDVTFRWIEKDVQGRVLVDEAATYGVRYTFPIELEHLLARAGFEAIDVRGGYDGAPRSARSRELVVTCRAPR